MFEKFWPVSEDKLTELEKSSRPSAVRGRVVVVLIRSPRELLTLSGLPCSIGINSASHGTRPDLENSSSTTTQNLSVAAQALRATEKATETGQPITSQMLADNTQHH